VKYLETAADWIERLDRGGAEGAGTRLYVYKVKNVKATDLADTLNDVFGGSGGSSSSRGRSSTDSPFAPGLETGEITSINDARRDNRQAQRQQNTGSGGNDGGVALVDGEEIRITAVEEQNSLLIRATPGQYDAVLGAIKRLDTEPLQVLVEVSESLFSDEIRRLENISKKIQMDIKDYLGVTCTVKLVEPKTIQRSEGKAQRVIDKRKI
jgi:type II secretory pathway component GspD/PulD (secretin)